MQHHVRLIVSQTVSFFNNFPTDTFVLFCSRGVYFACTLFHEDKVLVTSEEFLPVVEVDDNYPASVNNDFHWLMKIGCTWSDVKALRQDMERSLSSSSAHFRIKLLQAAAQHQVLSGFVFLRSEPPSNQVEYSLNSHEYSRAFRRRSVCRISVNCTTSR